MLFFSSKSPKKNREFLFTFKLQSAEFHSFWRILSWKSWKSSWNFVYITASQCRTPFNFTIFFMIFYLPEKIMKKFVKLWLQVSYTMQNSIHFDEIFCVAEWGLCFFFTWFTHLCVSQCVCFGAGCSYCGLTSPAPDSAGLQCYSEKRSRRTPYETR